MCTCVAIPLIVAVIASLASMRARGISVRAGLIWRHWTFDLNSIARPTGGNGAGKLLLDYIRDRRIQRRLLSPASRPMRQEAMVRRDTPGAAC
jgi:hypothetical protein